MCLCLPALSNIYMFGEHRQRGIPGLNLHFVFVLIMLKVRAVRRRQEFAFNKFVLACLGPEFNAFLKASNIFF